MYTVHSFIDKVYLCDYWDVIDKGFEVQAWEGANGGDWLKRLGIWRMVIGLLMYY